MDADRLAAATTAFAAELADSGVPARAAFAAAMVLDLPAADALNALLAAGTVEFAFVRPPADQVGTGSRELMVLRPVGAP